MKWPSKTESAKSQAKAARPENVRRKVRTAAAQAKHVTLAKLREAAQEARGLAGISPLEFMLSVMRDPKHPIDLRLEAARAGAPYCHRKMPTEVITASGNLSPSEVAGAVLEQLSALGIQPGAPDPVEQEQERAQSEAEGVLEEAGAEAPEASEASEAAEIASQ